MDISFSRLELKKKVNNELKLLRVLNKHIGKQLTPKLIAQITKGFFK